jgi:transposase
MLEQSVRHAILELQRRGQSVRAIARALQVSRAAVRDVLRRGSAEVPRLARPEKALDHREDILRLLRECEGSFVRVHEELTKAGLQLSYPALTAFCRRHGIGQAPKQPAGRYDFAPGQEMQHDTSPHAVHLGGTVRRVQTASLVLGYSRMLFFQFYPQFRRFECKVFLTEAFRYLDGVCQTCMIDNTPCGRAQGHGARHDSRARDGRLRRAVRLHLRRSRRRRRQPLRSRRADVPLHRARLPPRPALPRLGRGQPPGPRLV